MIRSDVRVGLLWRAEWDPFEPGVSPVEGAKLHDMFDAFGALGVPAEPVVYSDEDIDATRAQLLELDGVLVWVNPIEHGLDRSKLDPLLREVATAGVWVSAHPEVILRLATKEVLVDTKDMTWGTDARIYRSIGELQDALPERLAEGPRVLKQHRGMGGQGVWRVESQPGGAVVVQHAADAGSLERMSLTEFLARCETCFAAGGPMVEQPYQDRLPEGMIRVYVSQDEVVGFTHQYPRGLMPPGADERPREKRWEPPSEPRYGALRERVEGEWIAELQKILSIETRSLPVIWDIDFLYGPKTADGEDSYVLCEINASSTFAFPKFAMPRVAQNALGRIEEHLRSVG